MDELDLLDIKVQVKPCDDTLAQLKTRRGARSLSLSMLTGPSGKCVWCHSNLSGKRRRWCSEECVQSAQAYCYPQDPGSKMFRLIFAQNFACSGCGESFEDEIRKKIKDQYDNNNRIGNYSYINGQYRTRVEGDPIEPVSLYQIGYGTGAQWQTDHIKPIHKGGAGIDPENLQTLCVPCHLKKTAAERSNG